MLTYPDIDPIAIAIGPLRVHWYGLMYLAAFAAGLGAGPVARVAARLGLDRGDGR